MSAATASGIVTGPRRGRFSLGHAALWTVLIVVAIVWLVPFAWAFATSLKPDSETTVAPVSWRATKATFESYKTVFADGNIARWWFNSLLTSTLITAGTILTASMAAFAFSRIRFAASNLFQWLVLAGLIVPFQALIVPLFQLSDSLGMANTYWGIILPQIAAPIAVLVYKRAFDALPRDLEESALIDGASPWRIYWQLWMPLSRATTAAVGIFTFVFAWNNFIWPFVVTSSRDLMTVPVGLATVNAGYGALYSQQMALAILGALPVLVAFLLFQRQIVQGIANTGIKG
jgi:multiple sugar transport system permease protein